MSTPTQKNPWKIGFLVLAIAVLLLICYGVTVPKLMMSWERSNQFGGMFGGIGALFSGLALAGVVVAIRMQKDELELQRAELKRSAEAQTVSSQALSKQIDVMQLTAQLNAHTSLLAFYHNYSNMLFTTDDEVKDGNVLATASARDINAILGELKRRSAQHDQR